MSFQAMAWAVDHKLPAMQKIVLLMMANRFNEDEGGCWPSHDLLANECGMDKRSVIRQIDKLIELGLISVLKTRGSNGMNNVNRYSLNTNIQGILKSERFNKISSDRKSLGVVTQSHYVVTESHFGSDRESQGSDRESLGVVTESHPKQLYETIKETKETVLLARESQQEFKLSGDDKPMQGMQWVEYFVNERGFQYHEAQSAKTVPMFLHWETLGVTIADVEIAMLSADHTLNGAKPANPMYYRRFVEQVILEKQKDQSNVKGSGNVTKHRNNETYASAGRKLSLVEQAAQATARVEARERQQHAVVG